MTRKERILQAARDYVGSVTFSSPSDVIHFENGAKWADEHPVNMWHDMSEEPRKYEYILFEYISNKNELKYFTQYVAPYDGNLLKVFGMMHVKNLKVSIRLFVKMNLNMCG